ncbi:hypothetical protein [Phenylobacterium deserti]|uniref:Uncharacterized protein n=1 Tax=Phenylobacterium deserti TaxID=1914756 RepID=A0A328AAI6_9CAUL|nr:hypothetical protein [Phenylobacterium deserti]RAK51569.1 hypothetical protein DJ018_16710 [Phenylobacterium deserti]
MVLVPFPGGWRYVAGAVIGWLAFLGLIALAVFGRSQGWPAPVLVLIALGPAAIAARQFRLAWRLVRDEDEFVRGLLARRMLAAASGAIVLAIAWSGLEMVGAPHLPAWLLYPLVWGLFGMVTPLISGTARP